MGVIKGAAEGSLEDAVRASILGVIEGAAEGSLLCVTKGAVDGSERGPALGATEGCPKGGYDIFRISSRMDSRLFFTRPFGLIMCQKAY
jgi:hypothetical protein